MRRANLLAYFLVLGLAACGGGGGGGDSGTSSGGTSSAGGGTAGTGGGTTGTGTGGTPPSTRSPVPDQVALTYSGATAAATVNASTAATLASDTAASARLTQAMRPEELVLMRQNGALTGASVTQTIACDSGSINVTGTVADNNGTGTISLDYVDCRKGGDSVNGPATLRIDSYDSINKIITDGTLTFTRVRITGPSLNSDVSGTVRAQVSPTAASWCHSAGCATETFTENLIVQDNGSSRMTTLAVTVTNAYESVSAPTFFTQAINGTVSDGQLGSVNVGTDTAAFTSPWGPLYYSTRFQPFPDWGIINIEGATGTARTTSMGIALAKIEVDADGDGVFENNARMRWIDMATPAGSNLNDSDGDGMHDSWEISHGLNPNVNDAAADNDGDGYSNLTEYLAGSDPSTNGSVPSDVRDLWVTNVRDLGVDTTTGNINVFVGSSGSGVLLDPVTRELGAPFSGVTEPNGQNNRTVTDAQGRTFTLAPTASPTVWTLTSSTGTTITIDNVAGTNPGSLIRYGDRGIAFRTEGSSSPGYIYLVESRTLIP